jgi:hypothetical protein
MKEGTLSTVGKWLSTNVFRVLCLGLAGYFFYVFHHAVGLPPEEPLTASTTLYLVISLFFFLLPFAKKLKLGSLLEYESKIEALKADVRGFKEEVRQLILLQNNLISTVSNTLSQNINISIPSLKEAREAKEELNETISEPPEPTTIEKEIEDFLATEGSDLNFALAKLRIELERELRRILGMRVETPDPLRMKGGFLTAGPLFRKFVARFPKYEGMGSSFDYVLKVCNAAVHGQRISEGHAHEALYMGLRMLDELRKVVAE